MDGGVSSILTLACLAGVFGWLWRIREEFRAWHARHTEPAAAADGERTRAASHSTVASPLLARESLNGEHQHYSGH